jgi:5-methylcytosine-specific restriction endonuclease McrA
MARNPRTVNGTRYRRLRKHLLAVEDICCICGGHIDKSLKTPHPMSAEVEHLVPISKGGAIYAHDNCGVAHRICNQRKGNKMTLQTKSNDGMTASTPTSREW